MNISETEIKILYEDFIGDETLIGIKNLLNKHGIIGRYKEDLYKTELYKLYGKDKLKRIFHNRLSNATSNAFKTKLVEKIKSLESISEKLYQQFINDTSICGLNSLFKLNKIGSKTGGHIRKIIYDKYGKENIDEISFHRTAKKGNVAHNLVYKHHSDITRDKISKSNIETWIGDEERREQSRQSMSKYCFPKSHLEETKIKRIKSRSWYKHHSVETLKKISDALTGKPFTEDHKQRMRKPKLTHRVNFRHSNETKQKLSDITKNQWLTGIHKPIYKSKGHVEIMDIISKLGYKVEDEHIVCGKPFDVFVEDKNLLIEFNGTYWHRDPRFYGEEEGNFYWNKDKLKVDNAIEKGYIVKTIWQYDWENCIDKEKMIGEIINGSN
jgi:hypothetical protein